MSKINLVKLLALTLFAAGLLAVLFTNNAVNRSAHAYSSGPPAGYTRAPGEEPEACAECHLMTSAGTGTITINAPQTYVPGQTYQITVTHANTDTTRRRWGFELTALDESDERAGSLQSLGNTTRVLTNEGPFPGRQYIEHTTTQGADGTFEGQQGGASWTFSWTAPATNVGPVTFYAAGNHANGDHNTSGDNIYFTFAQALPASTTDFSIVATPPTQTAAPGNSAAYTLTLTPSNGFTGLVSLSVNGLPNGATSSFSPSSVNITNASAQSSTLTVNTGSNTPVGTYPLTVTAVSGALQHTATATLRVVSQTSADIYVTNTASPNPAVAGATLSYRIAVTNGGPAQATNVTLTENLPAGVTLGTVSATQGSCSGTGPINCSLGALASGSSAVVTVNVTPAAAGQLSNTASATASEADPDTSNNTATAATLVENPPAGPVLLDQSLAVKTVITGLDQPTSMAFIGPNEFFVLEKATGKVQHVFNGQLQTVALDLAVNNASERGLLGIALHPNFPATPYVYLYWTESATGVDTGDLAVVPLLGNRVDRYRWNGSTLTFDLNLIHLRAYQEDANQPLRGNHNGGVLCFGPDGKLYILIGDEGRRGFLQNQTTAVGPFGNDDLWGGPEPDDGHLTGVIIRLNDDGSTPTDNPFFNAATSLTGTAAVNVKKVFAYGVRNGFGMAFDPSSGNLWTQENGDDAFDEINRVTAGFNGGWVQLMGPSNRVAEFKAIETAYGSGNLQQLRWPPSLIADTPAQALSRLYQLPGSQYREPEFSWKYAVAPSPIGFVRGSALGAQFNGDLFVGASRTTLYGGYLFRMKLASDRLGFAVADSRLQDKVADNLDKFDATESESLLIGKNFGITTDIETGPDGNLYVVSLSNGAVYQIHANNSLQFSSASYNVSENAGSIAVTVTRSGNTAGAVTVDYATSDISGLNPCALVTGSASSRCDYATSVGTLRFAAGETSRIISIPIVADAVAEAGETFTVTLTNPAGAGLGPTASAIVMITNDGSGTGNPIDQNAFFIRQHYIDFLGREPDPPGFQAWLGILGNCAPGSTLCDRIEVSSAFFRSPEFQDRGYFVYRFYSMVGKVPHYAEFIPDMAKVSGFLSPEQLEANKAAFVKEFMARADFRTRYDQLTDPASYVNALQSTAGVTLSQRQQLIDDLTAGRKSRADVLRAVVESPEVTQKFFNEAFVILQYFGYLRRDADILYLNWIQTMNQNGGDYRVMINGFMNSAEYRQRFAP